MSAATYLKLKYEMKSLVIQTISEILNDPDFGFELSRRAKKRLVQASGRKQKNLSLAAIRQKYL